MLENKITDIFTEQDSSIFSENSIDPLGTRLIWTSLGNRIFRSKLNTVSTDIRLYTLNLFHHYLIYSCRESHEDLFVNISGRPPYSNREDLYDGIVIFLECLLTHAAVELNENISAENQINVPGILKLKSIKGRDGRDARAAKIAADKKTGILTRQILLGIHGRHKGPFQEMEIFDKSDYYGIKGVWDEADRLFRKTPWKELAEELRDIIFRLILNSRTGGESVRKHNVLEVLSPSLKKSYLAAMRDEVFKTGHMKDFWERFLGLREGTAGVLYRLIKQFKDGAEYEYIIRKACAEATAEERRPLEAVCAVEPLLACAEKIMRRLLKRGTSHVDSELTEFIGRKLYDFSVSLDEIKQFAEAGFLDGVALMRLKRLIDVFSRYRNPDDSKVFIYSLSEYHKDIMKERAYLPWLSLSPDKNRITLHRSYFFNSDELKQLEEDSRWINNYYLSTVRSLYMGLY